jgi:hypothetical protein
MPYSIAIDSVRDFTTRGARRITAQRGPGYRERLFLNLRARLAGKRHGGEQSSRGEAWLATRTSVRRTALANYCAIRGSTMQHSLLAVQNPT